MEITRDVEFAKKVRSKIKKWDDEWRFNKDQYHEFVSFVLGSQWTEDESKLFVDYKKVPLTANKLATIYAHCAAEQRLRTPNIQAVPDETVSLFTAQIREALIKDISLNSRAKVIYQEAFKQAFVGGFGAYYNDTEYESDESFDLVIVQRSIKDPTWCYWDLSCETIEKVDGMHSGFRTRMSRKKFSSLYGEDIESQIGSESNYDEGSATGWIFSTDKEITVIHHFEREYKMQTLRLLSNGQTVNEDQFKQLDTIELDGKKYLLYDNEIVTISDKRDVPVSTIMQYKLAGEFILEESEFPSDDLPVIFVDYDSYIDKSGKQICRPAVKDARDAQRFINYIVTQSAYLMKVSRYDQYIVSKANVRSPDTQEIWRDPATAQGGLLYDESPNGNKPEQQRPAELPASLINQYQRALNDIEQSTGVYATQLGDQGDEISGKAVEARKRTGNKNTYIGRDSIDRAVTAGAIIINQMIPRVYNNERQIKLMLPDSGMQTVTLNKQLDPYGANIENDMTKGNYHIRLVAGPSFEEQKEENFQSIQTVLQAAPDLFKLVADLYVENLPMANNIEMRNRLKTIVPQEIIQAGKTGQPLPPKPPQQDPMVMLKQQELQLKHMQIMGDLQVKMRDIDVKEKELQLQGIQTGQDISVEMNRLQSERLETAARLRDQELRYQAEVERAHSDMVINHSDNLVKLLTHKQKETMKYDQTT